MNNQSTKQISPASKEKEVWQPEEQQRGEKEEEEEEAEDEREEAAEVII